eukprot:PITA_04632
MESKLEFPQSAILTPYNYFEWKPKIQLHLRSRGLFRITMGTEVEPTSAMEKTRYFNRMDEAFGILCLSISPELLFHVESCSTPNEVWKILEGLFGKQDEMQGHILENELNSLDPRNFENIQDFFTRYKALLVQLKGCGIDKSKQENQLILSILSKLGPEYAVFVSTFHTVRSATGAAWKMPSLDSFIQSLMHEQDKLIKMGTLKNSKAHALTVHAKGKANSKDHQKGKGKKDPDPRKGGHPKPPDGSSGSKERKGTKGQSMCNYCHHGFHLESACMKKTIDLMAQTLQQHNLRDHIPENAKKKSGEKAPNPRGNGHALIALHSAPQEWIIDSGASHHMASSKESFSSLHASSGPPILMGDNSAVAATGQGRVQLEDGSFENVLHIPRISVNLLSAYQMTHTGSGRKVEFTPDFVSIYDMQTNLKIEFGKHPQEKLDKGHAWRASSPLEVVHSDLMGPFPVLSMSKARYVLSFIDDYTRFTWVYFLKLKSEVFQHLKIFKAHAENQSGKCIKILCTDNGTEYVNKDIENICDEAGIQLQHTVPYTRQQNGVDERKN